MAYATQADLIARYGDQEISQLTDRADPPSGTIDATALAPALAHADALIDSLVGARYPVPLSPVPQIVVDYACDIARYRLYGDAVPEQVARRYDDARRFLQDVAASRADLGVASPAADAGGVQVASDGRYFTAETLSDY